jgi:hypothetical protein
LHGSLRFFARTHLALRGSLSATMRESANLISVQQHQKDSGVKRN